MIKILITAGGTATAWHICTVIKQYFSNEVELHLCDINPSDLVPATILADKFHVVPPIKTEGYEEYMYSLLQREMIDIIIPLIDYDLEIFCSDNTSLKEIGVISTAPSKAVVNLLSNKKNMYHFLKEHNIPTPKLYDVNRIDVEEKYVLKSDVGFGSSSVRVVRGYEIPSLIKNDDIIQKFCDDEDHFEVTAEVFCHNERVEVFCRERRETKAGVCTKMKPIHDNRITSSIFRLASLLPLPRAFCIQFMYHNSQWEIIDCNLRLGAGTALSTAIGFQLTRAFIASLLGKEITDDLFDVDPSVKSVVRVYDEVVLR